MNKIIVIIGSLSLGLAAGCAGGLRLDSNSLFKNNKKAEEPAASSSDASSSGQVAAADTSAKPAAAAPADPAAERRAHYQPQIDRVDELLKSLPACCKGEDFLLEFTSTYPSDQFVKDYKYAWSRKSIRDNEDRETPEWKAVEAKYAELDAALAAAVRLPKDVYKAKDAKQVKQSFTDYVTSSLKKPVVEIVLLDDDWNRKSGSEWHGEQLVNYDQGVHARVRGRQGRLGQGRGLGVHAAQGLPRRREDQVRRLRADQDHGHRADLRRREVGRAPASRRDG